MTLLGNMTYSISPVGHPGTSLSLKNVPDGLNDKPISFLFSRSLFFVLRGSCHNLWSRLSLIRPPKPRSFSVSQMAVVNGPLKTSLFLFFVLHLLSLVSASPRAGHSNHAQTNGERLRKGLPPLAPRVLYQSSQADGRARRAEASPVPAPAPFTGGFATWYTQDGNLGASGQANRDSALVAALDFRRYGPYGAPSPFCNRQVRVTNTKNGKSVTVTIVDICPTCINSNSLDLSTGAFVKLADLGEGSVPITWTLV
ncbi:RlpA-like double-psi beta-barrel-protein domain-containing protein-containing protein [Coprinopsis sp. MPI-PUGE-AT-0042]|nr:RlpA-like double-psi beta-barrel-protein domain-containing protein-containing protein [Coprinopsis sp. MPI-PUGE-AT-0042]